MNSLRVCFNKLQMTWYLMEQCMSPRTALTLCDCFVLPSLGVIAPVGRATAGGAEALRGADPGALRKIL